MGEGFGALPEAAAVGGAGADGEGRGDPLAEAGEVVGEGDLEGGGVMGAAVGVGGESGPCGRGVDGGPGAPGGSGRGGAGWRGGGGRGGEGHLGVSWIDWAGWAAWEVRRSRRGRYSPRERKGRVWVF